MLKVIARSAWALVAVAVLALCLAPTTIAGDAEAPGTLGFAASNKMYSAEGKFQKWHFTKVDIPDGDFEKGTAEFEVNLASVWEKADALAEHLRQADFFDVAKFATATVKIHSAKKTGEGTYDATATVDFHGHTNDVPVSFKVVNESPLKIEGSATLQRTAFGIGSAYDPSNERSITDDVSISLSATLPN